MQRQTLKDFLIKYDTIDIQQALEEAIVKNNIDDVSELLLNFASTEVKNSEGNTALQLAVQIGNVNVVSRLLKARNSKNHHFLRLDQAATTILYDNTIIFLLISSSLVGTNTFKQISFIHAVYATKYEIEFYKKLPANSKEILENLSPPLKSIVYKRMFKEENIPELKKLFHVLNLPLNERKESIDELAQEKWSSSITDYQAIASILNICSIYKLSGIGNFETSIYMIDKNIMSYEFAKAFFSRKGYLNSNSHNYQIIKLINPDIINFNCLDQNNLAHMQLTSTVFWKLDFLVQEDCQNFLKSFKLSIKDFFYLLTLPNDEIFLRQVVELNSENIKLLSELFTVLDKESIKQIKPLKEVLTTHGIQALKEELLTVEQINKIYKCAGDDSEPLRSLLSANGLACLRDKLFTVDDAILILQIQDYRHSGFSRNNLIELLQDTGMKALKNEIISIDDAKNYFLSHINTDGAVTALQENLITIEQLSKFIKSYSTLETLCKFGLQALRDKLFTVEEILSVQYQIQLYTLLNPVGLIALRKKLITPNEAACVLHLQLLFNNENPDIIEALELKLLSPSDFYRGGKFEKGISADKTKYLITDYKNCDPTNPKVQKVMVAQNHCRRYYAQSKMTLFNDINQLLKSGKVNNKNVSQVANIVTLTENGNIAQAQEKIAKMKLIS